LLSFNLLDFSSIVFAAFDREVEKEFTQFKKTHRATNLVDAAVLLRHFNQLYWFSIAKKYGLRYV
jgi:hypothetical protein